MPLSLGRSGDLKGHLPVSRSPVGEGGCNLLVRGEMQVRHWKLLAAYLATALVALLLGVTSAVLLR